MADVTITAAQVRAVVHDPEDTLTLTVATGVAPVAGNLMHVSGANEVDLTDANAGGGAQHAFGMVQDVKDHRINGVDRKRATLIFRGLIEGFTGLTPGQLLYNSDTPGAIADAAPAAGSVIIGQAVTATAAYISLPAYDAS